MNRKKQKIQARKTRTEATGAPLELVISNNSKRIKNHNHNLDESRNAGRNKFDEIGKSLGFLELNWLSTLRRREYTWDTFIHSHTGQPIYANLEYWEKAAEGCDRNAFAAGFFAGARQSWNFETEEYEAPRTRNRSIYYALPEIVPFFIEVDLICHHWATYEHRRTWSICLGQSGGDFELHQLAEWRLKQLRKFVGEDRVAAITSAIGESQAAATPTLWRVYCEGTKQQREIVRRIAEQIGDDEMAIESAVKKVLELVPNREELLALAEHWIHTTSREEWNAFFGNKVTSDWDFVCERQAKLADLIGEDAFDKICARVHEQETKGQENVWRIVGGEASDDEEEALLRIYHVERAKHNAGQCDCKGAHVLDLETPLKVALEKIAADRTSHELLAAKPEVQKHGKK